MINKVNDQCKNMNNFLFLFLHAIDTCLVQQFFINVYVKSFILSARNMKAIRAISKISLVNILHTFIAMHNY